MYWAIFMPKFLIVLLILTSCSFYKYEDYPSFSNFEKLSKQDYLDHLKSLGKVYLKSPGTKVLQLSPQRYVYLNSIYEKILKNNEILLDRKIALKIFIVDSNIPFHFSLPGGQIFFSSELIKNFFESENLFICAFAFEIVKSHRNVYQKTILVPKGYLEAKDLLDLNKIPFESKIEIDKWAYLSMKRAGYDDSAYLIWLKIQNKNSFDFSDLLNGRNITKEEFVFKNFLVKELKGRNNMEADDVVGNSTKGYYDFLAEIRKISK